jgi:predicted nucleic acid-binding protein
LLLRRWVEDIQETIEVQSVHVPDDPRLALLDPGEREAIVLAQRTAGSLLVLDDGDARPEARRRGLRITGLLGVIRDAASEAPQNELPFVAEVEALVRRQYRERAR